MSEQVERNWISVEDFALYLGLSRAQMYRMLKSDPDVRRVAKKFGGRTLICRKAWQEGVERRMGAPA